MILLDLFNLIFSPFFTTAMLSSVVLSYFGIELLKDHPVILWANILSICQILLFVVGFFVTRASETRSSCYLRWMTTICNFAIWTSLVIIPLIVMTLIGVAIYRHGTQDLLLYHGLVQLGTIVWVLLDFVGVFVQTHEESKQLRDGVLVLRRRAKDKGFIQRTYTDIKNDVEPDYNDDDY